MFPVQSALQVFRSINSEIQKHTVTSSALQVVHLQAELAVMNCEFGLQTLEV